MFGIVQNNKTKKLQENKNSKSDIRNNNYTNKKLKLFAFKLRYKAIIL